MVAGLRFGSDAALRTLHRGTSVPPVSVIYILPEQPVVVHKREQELVPRPLPERTRQLSLEPAWVRPWPTHIGEGVARRRPYRSRSWSREDERRLEQRLDADSPVELPPGDPAQMQEIYFGRPDISGGIRNQQYRREEMLELIVQLFHGIEATTSQTQRAIRSLPQRTRALIRGAPNEQARRALMEVAGIEPGAIDQVMLIIPGSYRATAQQLAELSGGEYIHTRELLQDATKFGSRYRVQALELLARYGVREEVIEHEIDPEQTTEKRTRYIHDLLQMFTRRRLPDVAQQIAGLPEEAYQGARAILIRAAATQAGAQAGIAFLEQYGVTGIEPRYSEGAPRERLRPWEPLLPSTRRGSDRESGYDQMGTDPADIFRK